LIEEAIKKYDQMYLEQKKAEEEQEK